MNYHKFISSKHIRAGWDGFDPKEVSPALYDWQKAIVEWACRKGRAALFEDCGLGKTVQQLEWARQVFNHTGQNVLIVAPLAVNRQTAKESRELLGMECFECRTPDDVRHGVNITNYEMLHHFSPDEFVGVVLDESSILKSFMGTTKRRLVEWFNRTPYRLACTATPAPNDHTELGNHSEFLGLYTLQEMQSRWFVNDGFESGKYRLKGHAENDFWRWVASWAVCIQSPADLGYDGNGYILPELRTIQHVIQSEEMGNGMLVDISGISATGLHRELRKSAPERAERAAEIVNATSDPAVVWCYTDYEADELMSRIPDAVEVRGSMSVERKADNMAAFTNGDARVIVSKPRICGWGLNWQHCSLMVTVGPSYSFESRYQAVRRCWRYGQKNAVEDHVVMTRRESQIFNAACAKEDRHNEMAESILRVGHDLSKQSRSELLKYSPGSEVHLPGFLKTRR